jgi:quercetin dioxygenase-like cupin family protein
MTALAPPAGARARAIPSAGQYGNIVTRVGELASVDRMIGGAGVTKWMQLFSPSHLAGGWDGPIEYLRLEPGASCGHHLHHRREEIYYIVKGDAWMHVNGEELTVTAGDLITCPIGTYHSIGVDDAAQDAMTFLAVEMSPGSGARPVRAPEHVSLNDREAGALGYWNYAADDLALATVDLSQHLTGAWGTLAQVEVPPQTTIGPHRPRPHTTQLLLTTSGHAEVELEDELYKGGPGLAIGAVSPITVRNPSGDEPLRFVTLEMSSHH